MIKNFKRWLLLTSLPLGALIAFIAYYAVDVIYWDEWEIVTLLDKFYSGTLTFADLWAQHNEHRILCGKIIMLLNALLTNWNIYVELGINVLFAVCTSVIVYYASQKLSGLNYKKRNLLYFAAAGFIFSFTQYENWLWGFQTQIFMCVFFALLAFSLLTYGQDKFKYFIFAIIAAVFATFSFANGMMTWPVGFLMLLMLDNKNNKNNKLLIWMIIAALSIGSYLHGLRMPTGDNINALIHRPHVFIMSFILYLGSAVSAFSPSLALSLGLIGFTAQIYFVVSIILKKKILDKNLLFWLGAALYVILTGLITAYGRPYLLSVTSRYITINLLFWVSLIFQCGIIFDDQDKIPIKLYFIFIILILAHLADVKSFINANASFANKTIFKQQLLNGEYDHRHFKQHVYPWGLKAEFAMPVLKKFGIRNFENAPEVNCNYFKAADNFKAQAQELKESDGYILISGWDNKLDNFVSISGEFILNNYNNPIGNRAYLILYQEHENNYYETLLECCEHLKTWRPISKFKPDELMKHYKKNIFMADQIYYGNLPKGAYKTAIRISTADGADFYFKLDKILKVN